VAVTRRQTAHTLRLITPDAWQRTAVHSETGLVTLRQLLLHAINHLHHHLRFVAEKRAAMTTP
jgi:DinB family protein